MKRASERFCKSTVKISPTLLFSCLAFCASGIIALLTWVLLAKYPAATNNTASITATSTSTTSEKAKQLHQQRRPRKMATTNLGSVPEEGANPANANNANPAQPPTSPLIQMPSSPSTPAPVRSETIDTGKYGKVKVLIQGEFEILRSLLSAFRISILDYAIESELETGR